MTPEEAIDFLRRNPDLPRPVQPYQIQNEINHLREHGPDANRQEILDNYTDRVSEVQAKNAEKLGLAELEPDKNNDGTMDSNFEAACPDCVSGEPCCLREFEVSDKKASGRKITWPIPEGGPSKLFMVTKDPYSYLIGAHLPAVLSAASNQCRSCQILG